MRKIIAAVLAAACIGTVACADEINAEESSPTLVYAVGSQLMCRNDEVINMWDRPFIYNETTFVPLRNVVENIGGKADYDDFSHTISASYNGKTYMISANDERIRIFDGVSFVPMRELCETLGLSVGWNSGIVMICDGDSAVSDEAAAQYKTLLEYTGYKDEYFTPRRVVNPYVTYSYEQMNADVNLLQKMYPDLISVYSIGKTTEGRDITAFTLGKGDRKIILCGAMHAREYIAAVFLMYMADNYALAYINNDTSDGYSFRDALDSVQFIIIPMVNPDGINLVQNGYDSTQNPDYLRSLPTNDFSFRGWKATANGVDLNNNFDILWRLKGSGPSYAGYGGDYAASEPETRAMQDLINNTDFEIFASFHSQGQVIYWMDPNCNQDLVEKFSPYVDRICRETGFDKMPSDGEVGYSGYMTDYVRYFKEKMALTIEMCPYIGDYPYPQSDFDAAAYPLRNIGLILADISKSL